LRCPLDNAIVYTCPSIFEKDGYKLFFCSNEYRRIHVHVCYGGGDAVFYVESSVELRESQGLKVRDLSRAEQLAQAHQQLIVEKWYEHLD
jgi:hypothetical protein